MDVSNLKRAFTLLELIIVVLIIGVVYTLAIVNFSDKKTAVDSLSLSNLQAYMKSLGYEKSARFICLDDCSRCDMIVDGKNTEHYDNFLDKSLKTYRFDPRGDLVTAQNDPYFNSNGVSENVCFSFTVDKDKTGDQILILFKNRVYDFSDSINGTKIYNSLAEAKQIKDQLMQEVKK